MASGTLSGFTWKAVSRGYTVMFVFVCFARITLLQEHVDLSPVLCQTEKQAPPDIGYIVSLGPAVELLLIDTKSL